MTDNKRVSEESKYAPDMPNPSIAFNEAPPDVKMGMLDSLIGEGSNPTEVRFVLLAAILIALNNGFINGVCLSGFLSSDEFNNGDTFDTRNPARAMVSGVGKYVTDMATTVLKIPDPEEDRDDALDSYIWSVSMFMCYMGGSFIPGLLSPRSKPYSIDPFFGPSFMIGGSMLLASSLLAVYDFPTQSIFYLAIAANGVQNGVASIYSANLIRCTLTGATTDIGLVVAQMIRGNFEKLARAIVLAIIVISFWVGGLISYFAVRKLEQYTLLVNAGLFYLVGIVNIVYLIVGLKLSFTQALTGNWDWKTILTKIHPSGTKEDMLALFDKLDHDGGGTLDMYELEKGLAGTVTPEEMKALLNAADSDNSGDIDKKEWEILVNELFIVEE